MRIEIDEDVFSWHVNAACRDEDSDLFFPSERGDKTTEARVICRRCPLAAKIPCLLFALDIPPTKDWGVWGGTSRDDRNEIRLDLRYGRRTIDDVIAEVTEASILDEKVDEAKRKGGGR